MCALRCGQTYDVDGSKSLSVVYLMRYGTHAADKMSDVAMR